MTPYENYVLILCIIVFTALTALFSFLVLQIIKMQVKLIKLGAEDRRITKEYINSTNNSKKNKIYTVIDKVVSSVLCVVLFALFVLSLYMNITEEYPSEKIPKLSVVKSDSMSYKNEKNEYLFDNYLDNQLQTFDLILTYKLPKEEDLKLYDIVLYVRDKDTVAHRIVAIEEPNEKHGERYFLLQGDAIENPDTFPVYYSQMRGIYKGDRVAFIGSFIVFMQSVAGYLCILLVILALIAIPYVYKKLEIATISRLKEIGVIVSKEET